MNDEDKKYPEPEKEFNPAEWLAKMMEKYPDEPEEDKKPERDMTKIF